MMPSHGSNIYRLGPSMFFCVVLLLPGGLALNLIGKPASQSSNNNEAAVSADKAIDGDRTTIQHTNCGGYQWWKVDLEAIYCLTKIIIANRNDKFRRRLQGAVVRAGLSSNHQQNTQIGPAVSYSEARSTDDIERNVNPIVAAQYVSVELSGECLHMAEVMVDEIRDTLETSTVMARNVDFTLVTDPAVLGPTGNNNSTLAAYKSPADIAAAVSFGRQLTTGGSNDDLPTGAVGFYDPSLGCKARLLSLPEAGGIDRTGVFYSNASRNGATTWIRTIILPRNDIHTRPLQRTQTASTGESVTLQMEDVNSPNTNYRWKHNRIDMPIWDGMLSVSIVSVTQADEGIYSCFADGQENQQRHGFMRLIVRECTDDTWDPPSCESVCRRCYNGGICDDKTGRCVCGPGFSGEHCEKVQGRHVFGQNASHNCSDSPDPHHDACRGRLFCLPDPYGCSCAAGFTGIDCMQGCNDGMFGADCKQACHCASGDICEEDTGKCSGNCVDPYFGENCQCETTNGVLGLDVTSNDPYELHVSWLPDPCVPGYSLEYTLTNRGQCEVIKSPQPVIVPDLLDDQTTSHVITGLEAHSTYTVSLRPKYTGTQGPDVSTSVTTLLETNPSVSPVIITSYDSVSVTLRWREVNCANYSVEYALLNKEGCQPISPINFLLHCMCSGTNVTVISDLMANSVYKVRVKAFVDGNHGSAEEEDVTTSTIEPSASPADVTLLVRKKRQLSFSWSPPPCGSRGGIITGYVYKLSGRGPTILDDTALESETIPQLIPFTNYSFQVAANTSAGTGPYSEVVTGKTLEAEPTVPLNVDIQNVDDVSITVKWSEPDPPQGIITHYNVRYRRDGETENKIDTNVIPLVHSITGLDTNVTYYVQVQAETSVGAGPWSQEVNATTKIGIPGLVQNLRVKNTTETTITLDWKPPQNPKGHISHYIVRSKVFSSSDQYEKDKEMAPPFTKDKLNPATAYELAVSAHNEKFEGDSASLVVFTKPQTNPPEPPQPLSYGDETTETTVTIGLSTPADGAQFVESYVVRVKTVSGSLVSKRDVLIPDRFEDSPADYLAAEFPSQNAPNKFVVGDTKLYGGYYNAPLETGAEYEIRTGSVSQGNETEAYVTYSTPLRVTVTKPGMSPGMSPAVIAAIVVVIVIIIVGVVVALAVYKRRRASLGMHQSDMGSDFPLNEKSLAVDSEESQDSAVHHYTNDGAAVSDQPSQKQRRPLPKPRQNKSETKPAAEDKEAVEFVQPPPIRREDLAEYIRNKELSGDNGFLADYKSLPDGQLHPWTVASKPENKAKNRYVNVIAYDHSRVVLEPIEGDPHSDYVNACYINGYKSKGKYIASQGPNKASIKDIWRMVWQLGIDKIVMLTNPVENGKMKCLQYWADTGSTTISDIVVTTDKEDVFLDYTIRVFSVHKVGSDDHGRLVKQFHYTTWPDMKPPEYPAPVLNFLRLVNAHHNTGRTMVHCSAGVGRTGTFIALDVMLEQMAQEGQVDVLGFVYQMRQNRIKMVQTPDQYKFIFDALLAASVSGDTTYTTEGFRKKLAGLKKVQKGAKETGLQLQFANLTVLTASHGKKVVKSGEFPENKDKNRYPDFVPSDRSRPFLFTKVYDEDTDYINATFMPGYRKKNMYIGTQMPMPNTVSDFWRMVFDHKVPTIVMLNTFDANDKTMCRYWPEQGTIDFGPLLVELIGIKEYSGITERNFTLRNTKTKVLSEDVRRITQFQYHDWPSNEDVPRSVKGLLSLVELTQKQHDDKGPTAVHCMDGLGSTSVFCALMALVDQFKFEKAVDVFQAVHRLRMVNSNMMYSEGQYALCYDVVQTLLDSTSIYENVTPSNDSEI